MLAKCPPCKYWPNVRWLYVRWPNVCWPCVRWPCVCWPNVPDSSLNVDMTLVQERSSENVEKLFTTIL